MTNMLELKLFSTSSEDYGKKPLFEHRLNKDGGTSIKQPPRSISKAG